MLTLSAPAVAAVSQANAVPSATSASSSVGSTAPIAAPLPVLTSVRARHVGNIDRVVFGFSGGVPESVHLAWKDTLIHDASGLPVRFAGTNVLRVVMNGAVAHDQNGSTTRGRTPFGLPNVLTAVRAGDFEGVVTFGLGTQLQTTYAVHVGARRVRVDVGAGFPTRQGTVWFLDRARIASGLEPYAVAVTRRLAAAAPAGAALHALFAGPRAGERARGLRLQRSHAWGFDHLSIAHGIARLRLTHGCNSNGSTITVANEIMPTLKQFPSVDWVKIYGPGGHTVRPAGASDSIPTCLEP